MSNQQQQSGVSQTVEDYISKIQNYETQMEMIQNKSEKDLKKNDDPSWKLVLLSGIAGLGFHIDEDRKEDRKLIKMLKPGTELRLIREADNKHDRWAIGVYTTDNKMLGYVTRYKNETIARLMDLGYVFHAKVEDINGLDELVTENQATTENFTIPYSVWME